MFLLRSICILQASKYISISYIVLDWLDQSHLIFSCMSEKAPIQCLGLLEILVVMLNSKNNNCPNVQLFFFSWYIIQWLDVQPVQLSNWFPAFILYRQPLMSCPCLALVPMWINGFTIDRQSQLICYILWYEVKESLK